MKKHADFQEKRMKIFGELVKRYWKGQIKDPKDLDNLALDLKESLGFEDNDLFFIKDHIRICMGQSPNGKDYFSNELDLVKEAQTIKLPIISRIDSACEDCPEKPCECANAKYESEVYQKQLEKVVVKEDCLDCGDCIPTCDLGALADKIEFLPVINLLKEKKGPVFAAVAPSIAGQFGDVELGQLRTAFRIMGFDDMIEVALFADILTIKEALEFNRMVTKQSDFFLTSCCCPIWFKQVEKGFPELFKKMSPTVSPMIASGRILKELYKNAKVVFFSPCLAKKAEMKEKELEGSIDFCINFQELSEIFKALEIDLETLASDEKDQASYGGRIYARTGGVSFSVKSVINRLAPTRVIKLRSKKVEGVPSCREELRFLKEAGDKDLGYNFLEGMGCEGGCVGGPKTNIPTLVGKDFANELAEESIIMTPFDNINVMKILRQLGIEKIDELLTNEKAIRLLTREKE